MHPKIPSNQPASKAKERTGTATLTQPGKLTVCDIENGHRNSGFSQLENGGFSIVMWLFTRGYQTLSWYFTVNQTYPGWGKLHHLFLDGFQLGAIEWIRID